jgi:membrane dipeptidase
MTLSRRSLLDVSAAALAGLALPRRRARAEVKPIPPELMRQAEELHRRVGVFMGYFNFSSETFQPSGGVQSDLSMLDTAGIRTLVASIGLGCYFYTGPNPDDVQLAGDDEWLYERQMERVLMVRHTVEKCPRTRLITTAEDLAKQDDRIGVVIHLTGNNHMLSLDCVDEFFKAGVRAAHPAMQYHHRWCQGHGGMSAPVMTSFGREAVRRMNDLGITIDVAHASDDSALAIVDASSRPINDSHTTSRDLVPESRGLLDSTLKRIAASGGVAGILFADHMIQSKSWKTKYRDLGRQRHIWAYNRWVLEHTKDPDERMRLRKDSEAQAEFFSKANLPAEPQAPAARGADVTDLARAVDYLVKVMGIDHVGYGGDINGIGLDQWPEGLENTAQTPALTAELLRLGFSEDQLARIMRTNWERVFVRNLPGA